MATRKEFLDSILDDREKALLAQFADNEDMREVVRKVLLAGLYAEGTLRKGVKAETNFNAAFYRVAFEKGITNDEAGADLKATFHGITSLENAYKAMLEYRSKLDLPKKKENQAR